MHINVMGSKLLRVRDGWVQLLLPGKNVCQETTRADQGLIDGQRRSSKKWHSDKRSNACAKKNALAIPRMFAVNARDNQPISNDRDLPELRKVYCEDSPSFRLPPAQYTNRRMTWEAIFCEFSPFCVQRRR
jgi:hypothetical protein